MLRENRFLPTDQSDWFFFDKRNNVTGRSRPVTAIRQSASAAGPVLRAFE
jgi:hypothetical protein